MSKKDFIIKIMKNWKVDFTTAEKIYLYSEIKKKKKNKQLTKKKDYGIIIIERNKETNKRGNKDGKKSACIRHGWYDC